MLLVCDPLSVEWEWNPVVTWEGPTLLLVCDPIAVEWEPLSTKLDPSLVECDALERAGNLDSLLLEMECS